MLSFGVSVIRYASIAVSYVNRFGVLRHLFLFFLARDKGAAALRQPRYIEQFVDTYINGPSFSKKLMRFFASSSALAKSASAFSGLVLYNEV